MTEDRKRHQPKKTHRHRVTFKHDSATSMHLGQMSIPQNNIQKSTVFHLVYKCLKEVAERDMRWRQRCSAYNRFRKQHARKKNIHERDFTLAKTNFGPEIDDVRSKKGLKSGKKRLFEIFGKHKSSSEECITDYEKAVSDVRKRGKFYVQDALCYGLQLGLLIPNHHQRNVLRVSEKLRVFLPKNSMKIEERSSVSSNES